MEILAQFLLRLSFGLAFGMAITSPQQVSSGYFRNHLYVTLGLTSLAAMATYSIAPIAFWFAIAAAAVSYVGSVLWLYEKSEAGKAALILVLLFSLIASYCVTVAMITSDDRPNDRYLGQIPVDVTISEADTLIASSRHMGYATGALMQISIVTSGLLLGTTTAAMLLGHWYLNSPGMHLTPLRRLLVAMGAAILMQAVVSAIGLAYELRYANELSSHLLLFVLLRWSFGLIGAAILAWMAWGTLKIPNTQSATGILYVAVIGVFVGELTGLLLSAESAFPL
jgi:hypothetical protein